MERRRLAVICSHLCQVEPRLPALGSGGPPARRAITASACHGNVGGADYGSGGSEKGSCVFCRIVRGESPAFKLYEDDVCLCILDSKPLTCGHSLIIPKSHYSSLDATPPLIFNFMTLVAIQLHTYFIYSPLFVFQEHFGSTFRSVLAHCLQVIAAMCSTIPLLSNAIMKATKCNSFNLLVNSGAAAGQVVFHTHLHIIPRKDNDCLWTSESSLRKPLKLSQETVNLANRIRQQLPFPKCSEINSENHEPKLDENS